MFKFIRALVSAPDAPPPPSAPVLIDVPAIADNDEPDMPSNVIPLHRRGISRAERIERQSFRWDDHYAGRGPSARPGSRRSKYDWGGNA